MNFLECELRDLRRKEPAAQPAQKARVSGRARWLKGGSLGLCVFCLSCLSFSWQGIEGSLGLCVFCLSYFILFVLQGKGLSVFVFCVCRVCFLELGLCFWVFVEGKGRSVFVFLLVFVFFLFCFVFFLEGKGRLVFVFFAVVVCSFWEGKSRLVFVLFVCRV